MTEHEIFAAAIKLASDQRAAFLDIACRQQDELRQQVEALLKAHDESGGLLPKQTDRDLESTYLASSQTKPGTVIAGRYKLLEAIGEGGMGTVWVAEQTQPVRRKVAIKLIKAGMDSRSVLARFEAERQALALMDHPHIAKVFDGGVREQGRPYFVMEYVKGVPLTEYCDAARLPLAERLKLFVPVCQAVQHAHQKGIIHRDLKPSNILVCLYDGKPVPKVIDFGLAKAMHQSLTEHTLHTAHGLMMGTPLYMSPEQAELNNLDVDTRTDIYSLGVILYELLTGSTPLEKQQLQAAALNEVLRLIKEVEPPKPSTRLSGSLSLPSIAAQRSLEPGQLSRSIKGELDWIVMKALDKERSRRYETATGLARDVERYLNDETVEASPPSTSYRMRKFVRKHRVALGTATAFVVLLLAGTGISVWQWIRATNAEADARQAERKALLAQEAEAKRADAERLAKQAAEANGKLANQRLVQVEVEKKRAEEEKQIAEAVKFFLQNKLLQQADVTHQADSLLLAGELASDAKENPTIRELLDRAALELTPARIDTVIPEPLVQAEILQTIGDTYRGVGEYERGISFLQRSVAIRKQYLGTEHPATLNVTNNLAVAYQDMARFDLAVEMFEEIVKLAKAKLGPDDTRTLSAMHNLAGAYEDAGRRDLALPLFEETLKLTKAKLGSEHSLTLTSMNSLAVAYRADGKLDLALPLFEESLKLSTEKLGPEHPRTLNSMNSLAGAYRATRKLGPAVLLFEKTLKLRKAKLGPNHPGTLESMNGLAMAYQDAGKMDLTVPLFVETLKLRKAKLGPEHRDTLISMHNLAMAYQRAGELRLSIPLLEELVELRERTRNADHSETFDSMFTLATSYALLKQHDKAIALLEQVLTRQEGILGRNHPTTLQTIAYLAATHKDAGQLAEALPLFEEAYQSAKSNPPLRWVCTPLLELYVESKRYEQAEKLALELVGFVRRDLPKGSPQLAGQLASLGRSLFLAKAFAKAEPLLRESLAIRDSQEPDAWSTFNTKSLLGGAMLGQTNYAEAEQLLLVGYEGMSQRESTIPLQSKPRLVEALDRLIELYTATDKPEEVQKWQAERAKHPSPDSWSPAN